MKFVCIHGHFYQPPRENPWLEAIEPQDAAAPYHDWNERISAECYEPNSASRILDDEDRIVAIVNNYSRMSFNFGPTLLSWMEGAVPAVYEAILDADRNSQTRFDGHGSALAQVYNHVIMPLASREDKNLQVVWGLHDFEKRFGRKPEGMWLPETAVDLESLDVLAEHGIRFTILAPSQAARVRRFGDSRWADVSDGRIDPTRAYLQKLPSGREIHLFFYDGPVSRAVAFEGLLDRGDRFAERLVGIFDKDGGPQIAHIATDGESYGHHHPHGDMALAYALDRIESEHQASLTVYGAFLETHPAEYEVAIRENTSWSCAHGIERWRCDCGCHTGGQMGWNQSWRGPLRDALNRLRDRLVPVFEERAGAYFQRPEEALLGYADVLVDRSAENIESFLRRFAPETIDGDDQVEALQLLELRRHLQLMFTSCGWFFSELSGIETVQILQYAGRAIQLAESLSGESVEPEFLVHLEPAKSNLPEIGTGRKLYERRVRPSKVTWEMLAAHYGISCLFETYPPKSTLYCYDVDRETFETHESDLTRLVVGKARLTSLVTRAEEALTFAVLHWGGHNVMAGVRRNRGRESYRELVDALTKPLYRGDTDTVSERMERHFGEEVYGLKSLFGDEQRRIVAALLRTTLTEAEEALEKLFEHHGSTMNFLAELGVPSPKALRVAAEVVLNTRLKLALSEDTDTTDWVGALIQEAATEGIALETASLAFTAGQSLERIADSFFERPESLELLERLGAKVRLVCALPFEVDLWRVQNLYFQCMKRELSQPLDRRPPEWLDMFRSLGECLSVRLPEST